MSRSDTKKKATAKSRLFSYLEKVDKEDIKQIQKYLQSPFFKVENRERVLQLFDFVKKFHPDYNIPKLTNEALERKMKFTNFNNVKSTLITCIEEYFKIKAFQQNEHLQISLFSKTLNDLNLDIEFHKYTQKEIEKLNEKQVKEEDDYHLKYKLLLEMFAKGSADMVSNKNTHLENCITALKNYFLYVNLKNILAYNSLTQILNRGTNIYSSKKMISSLDYDTDVEDFNIKILYNIFMFNEIKDQNQKENVYYKLKDIVKEKYKIFSMDYKYEVYANMINMALNLKLIGMKKFSKELFEIHKFWVDQKVHLTYKVIHSNLFFNIVASACNVKEFFWYQNFAENNKQYLLPNEREQTLKLASCYFSIKTGKYNDVLMNLGSVKFLNVQFNYIAKAIEIQALYELNDPYRFEIYQKNFRNYILRQKEISKRAKVANSNFIKAITKIEKARHNKNSNSLEMLKKNISEQKEIMHRPWLLEKINELL